ncbi:hypothetical protein C8J56DRAFT_1062136 [Mycena floridula]|nr:hypothetical protein C8J56DRAFT_1063749 [Mycena floridula]KAJ7576432.1 hypothetical protein C8J56DRAFT_1062136 [Mycena floridula]
MWSLGQHGTLEPHDSSAKIQGIQGARNTDLQRVSCGGIAEETVITRDTASFSHPPSSTESPKMNASQILNIWHQPEEQAIWRALLQGYKEDEIIEVPTAQTLAISYFQQVEMLNLERISNLPDREKETKRNRIIKLAQLSIEISHKMLDYLGKYNAAKERLSILVKKLGVEKLQQMRDEDETANKEGFDSPFGKKLEKLEAVYSPKEYERLTGKEYDSDAPENESEFLQSFYREAQGTWCLISEALEHAQND